jgi:peptidoglycan/xylan/chitin deacetylase (PgdA/CDA1 family)
MSARIAIGLRELARRASRRLAHSFGSPALILMYHRVAELASDPQLLCVTPHHFAEHLDVLGRRARVLRLAELDCALRGGHIPHGSVVVTLDDGYADNLLNAKPLLERHDVPVTVFATAGRLGSDQEFWWDELDRILLQPGSLPCCLELALGGHVHRWTLGAYAAYDDLAFSRARSWDIEQHDDPTTRQQLYRSLYHLLQPLPNAERQIALETLRRWAGAAPFGRPSHRMLTVCELSQLAAGGLLEVGAHTMNHPMLEVLPASVQWDEIQGSRTRLEDILDRPVDSFAYPHSSAPAQAVALVKEAGFGRACAGGTHAVSANVDPYQLPRLAVRDWDGERFARFLSFWLDG